MSEYFKVLTHDYRPPVQGGEPIWDGKNLPHALPAVTLDTSALECGAGWHCTETLAGALRHGGFWPEGRPAAAFAVEPGPDQIRRGDMCRASTLTLVRRATEAELRAAVLDFSQPFGVHADRMAMEQWAWYVALGRPERDPERVEAALRHALDARGLGSWTLLRFEAAGDAWAARDYMAAKAARDNFAAGCCRQVWTGTGSNIAFAARFAWGVGYENDRAKWAAFGGRDARNAWAARDALTVMFVTLSEKSSGVTCTWTKNGPVWETIEGPVYPPDLLTVGLREAYYAGLEIAVPTGKQELGWAMADLPETR